MPFLIYSFLIFINMRRSHPLSSITLMILILSIFTDLINLDIIAFWLALAIKYNSIKVRIKEKIL